MITSVRVRNILIAAAMALTMPAAHAQLISMDYKRSADQFYGRGDYYSAAQYYEKYLAGMFRSSNGEYNPYQVKRSAGKATDKRNNRSEAVYRIADSYYKLHDYLHAEQWYQRLLETDAAGYPDARYKYGVSLRANGQYAKAQQEFSNYIGDYAKGGEYLVVAKQELENCRFIQRELAAGSVKVAVSKLNGNVNKEGASYAAGWQDPQTLVFTSTRSNDSGTRKPEYVNALYHVSALIGGFSEPEKLDLPEESDIQQGVAAFDASGNTVFFTRWSVDRTGKKVSAIYKSEKSAIQWTKPVKLDATVNQDNSSSRQPFITPDGKFLLFASDRPGGRGGFDIWYASLKNGVPGEAFNAGAMINTPGNEESPFYHAVSHQLVFSSNGKTGMGGYDLYSAPGDIGGSFQAPQNMGYPVNSVKDDIYFTTRGNSLLDSALISSDRASQCCLELFAIDRIRELLAEKEPAAEAKPDNVEDALKTTGNVYVTRFVNFEFGKKELASGSHQYLDEVVEYLKAHPGSRMEVAAHTDGLGGKAFNQRLSDDRARVCVDYLISKRIEKGRLIPKGYGDCCPLEVEITSDGKDLPAAREKNRRVELKLL